jgi:NitT/TauT family transport system permease protein
MKREIPVRNVARAALITVLGFLIAILGNLLIPQVAELTVETYKWGPFLFNLNSFYRLVLGLIIVFYLIAGARALKRPELRPEYVKQKWFRFAMGLVLLVYDLAGTKLRITPQPFFPGPAEVLKTFLDDGPYLMQNTLFSLRLFGVGFGIGILLGLTTGVLIGWFPKVYYWVYPIVRITGVIPAVAWMPFALTLFPNAFSSAVFLMAICSWFPIASQTAFGIQTTEKSQFEAARTLGAKNSFLVFHVAIPHAMPQIFNGIQSACGNSFTFLVIAEMMGQPGGLGYYINISKIWAIYGQVFAAILVMALLFSVIIAVLNQIKAYVLRWQKGRFV